MKNRFGFWGIALLAVWMFASSAYGAADVKVICDGKELLFAQPPIVEEGRILVPLRTFFDALEAEISWDQEMQTVKAVSPAGKEMVLTIGQTEANIKDGEEHWQVRLDVPAQIVDGRTFIPVRAVSELMAAEVSWDEAARLVNVRHSLPAETGTPEGQVFTGKAGLSVSAGPNWRQVAQGKGLEENDALVLIKSLPADPHLSEVNFTIKADTLKTLEQNLEEMRSEYDALSAEQKAAVLDYYLKNYPESEHAAIKHLFTDETVDYQAVGEALNDFDLLERLRSGGLNATLVKKEPIVFLGQTVDLMEIEADIEGTLARYYTAHTVWDEVSYTLLVSGEKGAMISNAAEIKAIIESAAIQK